MSAGPSGMPGCGVLRGLDNDLPTWVVVLLVVGLILAVVLFGVWLARRYVPATREGFDAEVSSQLLGVVATVFGLLLAFVVVITFQGYSDADSTARQEADALAQIVRDSGAFSAADHARVGAAAGAYVRAVVNDEWPRLREGHNSALAWSKVGALYRALESADPTTPAARSFYDDSVSRLNDALAARRHRISVASGELSSLVAGLLLLGTFVILGYVVLVGSRSAAFHAIGAGSIALVLGFSLAVLLLYNYPYSGDLAINPHAFQTGVLAQYFQPR
jgi:hypothetical protein